MNEHKPTLLLYCQHSLGMGHWVRAMTLARALTRDFRVTFLNGGRAPGHQSLGGDLTMIDLPPLGMGEDNQLYSQDPRYSVDESLALRRQYILDLHAELRPDVILIELFPFGRKKLAGELLPLLRAARRAAPSRPLVLCSLRDIMVNARKDQTRHDERARWITDRYFDGLMIHSDPRFARLEDTFRPRHALRTPVHYTGFVAPAHGQGASSGQREGVLVSAGGGMVGGPLFRAALEAHRLNGLAEGLPMTLVAGPFLPEEEWQALQDEARGLPGLTLLRSVPAMKPLLESHCLSVSQCGYNTVMDILESGAKPLVVPFVRGHEDEQNRRAVKLEQLGLVRALHPERMDGHRLAEEIRQLRDFIPNPSGLDLSGAQTTTRVIRNLLAARQPALAPVQSLEASDAL
ncbi:glycosyltransferase family protein [Methyloterricola oryzae]|uniref:glycosyltransferase family protein n=1 Tax=Methyloterricola oryzae TaxID=1495050 RepID=UPI0005EBCAB8|nr:glycosyltransferase [Methyloterricola oryzae]